MAGPSPFKDDTMTSIASRTESSPRTGTARSQYPLWFLIPALVIFAALFLVPTLASFYFSLTRWSLRGIEFIGLDNFVQFFREPFLFQGVINTLIFATVTSTLKVVLGMALGVLLTSQILGRGYLRSVVFFPVLVSTVGIGFTFSVLMHPSEGLINQFLGFFGIDGPGWLTDPQLALLSVALIDVWRGVGLAALIYIAGMVAIPQEYFEAARVDGAGGWRIFRNVTLPLLRPATATVVILSVIGGLRLFDLIWATTGGGPGFSSDVVASVIFRQYQAGFWGLSTAGNVVLFAVVILIVLPMNWLLNRKPIDR